MYHKLYNKHDLYRVTKKCKIKKLREESDSDNKKNSEKEKKQKNNEKAKIQREENKVYNLAHPVDPTIDVQNM